MIASVSLITITANGTSKDIWELALGSVVKSF
jgi:hypothetical protein